MIRLEISGSTAARDSDIADDGPSALVRTVGANTRAASADQNRL